MGTVLQSGQKPRPVWSVEAEQRAGFGVVPGSGAPTKGDLHPAFPMPVSHAPAATCSVLGGTPLHPRLQSGALALGSRGSAHRHLLPGLPVNQVKGWGAGRGLASKGSDFLRLILLFDLPPLQRDLFIETSRSIETGSPAFAVVKMPDGWLGAGRSPGCSLAPRALGPKFQFGGMCRPWLLQEMAVLSLQGPVVPEMLLAFLHSEFLFFSSHQIYCYLFSYRLLALGTKKQGLHRSLLKIQG